MLTWRQQVQRVLQFQVQRQHRAASRYSPLKHSLKPGFHYPSSRPEFTARELACIFWHSSWWPKLTGVKKCTRVYGPSTRVVETGLNSYCHQTVTVHSSYVSLIHFLLFQPVAFTSVSHSLTTFRQFMKSRCSQSACFATSSSSSRVEFNVPPNTL